MCTIKKTTNGTYLPMCVLPRGMLAFIILPHVLIFHILSFVGIIFLAIVHACYCDICLLRNESYLVFLLSVKHVGGPTLGIVMLTFFEKIRVNISTIN